MKKTTLKKQQVKTAIISLKDAYNKGRHTKRAKKSIFLIKKYINRHLKTDIKNIKIGMELNEFIWKHGIKNPPRVIKIQIYKKDKLILVNLTNIDIIGDEKKREEKIKLKKEEQKKEAMKEEEKIKAEEELKKEEKEPQEQKKKITEKYQEEKIPLPLAKAEVKKSPADMKKQEAKKVPEKEKNIVEEKENSKNKKTVAK